MSLAKICKKPIVTISDDASLINAALAMKQNNIGDVVVVKNDKPVGILTDRDIVVKVAANDVNLSDIKVSDVMSSNLLILKADQGINAAINAMREKSVRRAPVIDGQNKLIGIATVDDLLILLASELKQLSDIIAQQAAA